MATKSLLGALMNLRIGRVLTPLESLEASSCFVHAPVLEGYSLSAAVPNWLVVQLADGKASRQQQFALLTTKDQRDPVFMLVTQTGSTQLRLLMHINDARVQAILRDACSRGRLNVLMVIDHGAQASFLSTPMPTEADTLLPELLASTCDQTGSLARVLKLGAQHTLPQAVPSLLSDEVVTDVVAVLIADGSAQLAPDELNELTGGWLDEAKTEETAMRLH